MSEKVELKLCPFCESKDIGAIYNEHAVLGAIARATVICNKCGARGPYHTYGRHLFDKKRDLGYASYLWQQRPLEDALQAKLDVAVEQLRRIFDDCDLGEWTPETAGVLTELEADDGV